MAITLTKSNLLSESLCAIFWDVFFASKGRGLTFNRHFPWTRGSTENITYLQAVDEGEICGGLLIREVDLSIGDKVVKVGLIGLVCVVEHRRGEGIAGQLVSNAILLSRQRKVDYLTLWTSQHHVYSKHGFVQHDDWLFGNAIVNENVLRRSDTASEDIQEAKSEELAIPPFATEIKVFRHVNASITVLYNGSQVTLADYEGEVETACDLILKMLPSSWRVNIRAGDPLIATLRRRNVVLELELTNLQMWLCIASPEVDFRNLNIKMLDRI